MDISVSSTLTPCEQCLVFSVGLSVWRLHHDMIAVATAIGLHCYQGSSTVTMRSEMMKRLSACCFWNDKEIAMFTGRPPALDHRYLPCPLPLDRSENALFEGGDKLGPRRIRLECRRGNLRFYHLSLDDNICLGTGRSYGALCRE